MSDMHQQQAADEYHLRPYRTGDRDRFLSLYETVWDRRKGREWFRWRFEDNPYRDGVRMAVVESGGEFVGAEPLLPFRIQLGETVVDVFQPVDWIVHPDHRRRGLFTMMTESVIERYLPEVALFFNFPNELLLPGLRKFDWRVVGPVACRYRVQNTRAFVEGKHADDRSTSIETVGKLGAPLVRGGLSLLDRVGSPAADVTVRRFDEVPVEVIHGLYRSSRPECVHVVRDRPFLRWRFANPNWETTSYVAFRNGEPVASVVTATENTGETRVTSLLDVQPMGEESTDAAAFDAIVRELVADNADADLLRAGATCPSGVLRRHGFVREDTFPLSLVSTPSMHAIRLPTIDGLADGHDDGLTDPERWHLTLADIDIG